MRTKKKSRWKRVILWSFAAILVLGVSGLFAVNYAVNKVIDSMAQSLEEEMLAELEHENNISDITAPEDEASTAEPIATNGSDPVSNPTDAPTTSSTTSTENTPSTPEAKDNTQKPEKTSNSAHVSNKNDLGKYSAEISAKKAVTIKENISIAEKATVTSILVGKLSLSDLNSFKDLASGGMSVDEKRAARKVLLDKLSPEEYDQLASIAKKYGISRGKSYTEAEIEEADEAAREKK